MNTDLTQEAVQQAMLGNWNEAKDINLRILKTDKDNIDALNRLAKAYAELGDTKKSQTFSRRTLKLDPQNSIATNFLKKLQNYTPSKNSHKSPLKLNVFLEDPKKTKSVQLLKLGPIEVISKLNCGDEVYLNPHPHSLSVANSEGEYIGKFPEDMGVKIGKIMHKGIVFEAFVKSVQIDSVFVFIKEKILPPNTT